MTGSSDGHGHDDSHGHGGGHDHDHAAGHAAEDPHPAGRFHGLSVPDPGFAADDGSPDPVLRALLADHTAGHRGMRELVARLVEGRLLVPVVAVLDSTQQRTDGTRAEKDSHMAAVSLIDGQGRRAMLAFTGTDSLVAWDPAARPVPARTPLVAQAAEQEGAVALLIDAAGPYRVVIDGLALHALAAGAPAPPAHQDPAVRDAVAGLVLPLSGVRRVRLDPGTPGADLTVVVDAAADEVDAVLADVAAVLSRDPVLREHLIERIAVTGV